MYIMIVSTLIKLGFCCWPREQIRMIRNLRHYLSTQLNFKGSLLALPKPYNKRRGGQSYLRAIEVIRPFYTAR